MVRLNISSWRTILLRFLEENGGCFWNGRISSESKCITWPIWHVYRFSRAVPINVQVGDCEVCIYILFKQAQVRWEPSWHMVQANANGHCTASQYSAPSLSIGRCSHEPTENFIINFLFLNAWKLLKIILKYPYLHLTLSNTPKF